MLLLAGASFPGAARAEPIPSTVIAGKGDDGRPVNPPADWPEAAGIWNAKAVRYNPASDRLVFETFREDILGTSELRDAVDPSKTGKAANRLAELVFTAGEEPVGTFEPDHTSVLYIADHDGRNARCIGCETVADGVGGVEIWKIAPSGDGTPSPAVRQIGAKVFARQNKDLAAWHPGGKWITASVEMPSHAGSHFTGHGEIGMFNDIWAISDDGRVWVQLTDWQAGWVHADPVARMPYQAADPLCPTGDQYGTPEMPEPYAAYACSPKGAPPPVNGVMRTTVGQTVGADGRTLIVWGERVGIDTRYPFVGPLQFGRGKLAFTPEGLPAIVDMKNNLTPTPGNPMGEGLWSNPGGRTVIGTAYEPFNFAPDDTRLALASDAFLSHKPGVALDGPLRIEINGVRNYVPTQAFWDLGEWRTDGSSYESLTLYDPAGYAYPDNASPAPMDRLGYFEEPSAYLELGPDAYIAVGSSVNPDFSFPRFQETFFLETWIFGKDAPRKAAKVTDFNAAAHLWTYPTSFDAKRKRLYLVQQAGGKGSDTTKQPTLVRVMDLSGIGD
ncbi:MAG: hypothetical protein H6923_01090 [Alphaproteobacteria bacterium]|nr:hypothetical protein [Alphaproteobacteria bacterium]